MSELGLKTRDELTADRKKPMGYGGNLVRELLSAARRLGSVDGVWGLDSQKNQAETVTSLEQKAAPIIEALEAKYPDSTFELIGDTVVCTDPRGVCLGDQGKDYDPARSWDGVMADTPENDECFIITVEGEAYDPRKCMTVVVYKNMIAAKRKSGKEIPDCRNCYDQYALGTLTLITGEAKNMGEASSLVAWADLDGNVTVARDLGNTGARNNRVRPAVKVV